jgi:hypothetical protein
MKIRIAAIIVLVTMVGAGVAVASRQTDTAIERKEGLIRLMTPGRIPGVMIEPSLIVGAGTVVAYSPNLDEKASKELRKKFGRDGMIHCWVKVRIDVPIAQTNKGEDVTIYFLQVPDPAEGMSGWGARWIAENVRFTGGEKLLVIASLKDGKYYPFSDIFPVSSYDSEPVTEYQELARWDRLKGQEKLDAIAQAAESSGNGLLRRRAIAQIPMCGRAYHKQDWAFNTLSRIAHNKADKGGSLYRIEAVGGMFGGMRYWYNILQRDGKSGEIVSTCQQMLNDPSIDREGRQQLLSIVEGLGYKEDAKGPNGRKGVFRQRPLDIVDAFLKKEKSPELRRDAQRAHDALARGKSKAGYVVTGS